MEELVKIVRCAILALAGCDTPAGGGFDSGDSGLLPPIDSLAAATQVGSEGFWDCLVEELRPIADPTARIDALGGSAQELVAARVGAWNVAITPGSAGILTLADRGLYVLADVTEASGCEDHLVATVSATLSRDAATHALSGSIAVSPSAGRLLLADDDLAAASAAWGAPSLAGAVAFRLEGDLDPARLDAVASYVDCADPMADCPGVEVLADVDGSR
jgi:hypothetical protein